MSEAIIVAISRSPVAPSANASRLQDVSSVARGERSEARREAREDLGELRRWKVGFFAFYSALAVLLSALAMVADHPQDAQSRPVRPALLSHQPGLPDVSFDGRYRK